MLASLITLRVWSPQIKIALPATAILVTHSNWYVTALHHHGALGYLIFFPTASFNCFYTTIQTRTLIGSNHPASPTYPKEYMLLKTKVHTLGPAAAVTNVTDIGASTSDQVTIVGFFSRVRCACATLKIVPLQDFFLRRRSTWFPEKRLYQISHHYFVLNHYITLNRDNMVTLTFSSSNRRFSGPRILGCFTGNFDRVLESEYSSSYSELALPFCWLKASWKCKSSGIKRRCMCGWIFWCYCNASWSLISKTALV